MQLNVLGELLQRVGKATTYDVDQPSRRLTDVDLESLSGRLTLLRTDRGLLASIDATATIQARCSRCLVEADCILHIEFEEEYVPVIDAITGARIGVSEGEDVFRIGPDFVLDLREGLRQYVLMAEPTKPLCKPDCAGLCPECGADRNKAPCRCRPDGDMRWRALAGLKISDRKGS